MQDFMVVDDLKTIGVFVEPAAVDDRAVFRHDTNRTVDRHHLTGRVDERSLERTRAPRGANVAEVGADTGPVLVDPVTLGAGALAEEDGASARLVAGLDR